MMKKADQELIEQWLETQNPKKFPPGIANGAFDDWSSPRPELEARRKRGPPSCNKTKHQPA
jgi:hypothetical protein